MGTLIAMHYSIAGGLADHTYVKCSTDNAAWRCFGEQTGGNPLRRGDGSTMRADKIAGPNEDGNLNCYLINGVCHQAANRILLPAGLTVAGALGYSISRSLFGTYGRSNGLFDSCKSPFNQYSNVQGDLPECVTGVAEPMGVTYSQESGLVSPEVGRIEQDDIQGEIELYERANWKWSEELSIELFTHMVKSHLGWGVTGNLENQLINVRAAIERKRMEIEEALYYEELNLKDYAEAFDELTLTFQRQTAEVLSSDQYENLFGLKPEYSITLADPNIISPPSLDKSIDQEEDMPRGPTHG